MKPYYQDDAVTIYHGDCREILPTLDDIGVIVTDPLYGLGTLPPSGGRKAGTMGTELKDLAWDKDVVDWLGLWGGPCAVFCGGQRVAELVSSMSPDGMLIYVKSNPSPFESSFEPCFTRGFAGRPAHFTAYNAANGQKHPTQKPLDLMRWIVGRSPDGTILDPFMGSGTTLVAAKRLGRRAIGIELEEKYCEIAARRCGDMSRVDADDEPLLAMMQGGEPCE